MEWTPRSGVGVAIQVALLRSTGSIELDVLVGFGHSAVVAGSRSSSSQWRFGKETLTFSRFLAVVFHQTITLQGLFALVVGMVVAEDWGQVTVLWPYSRG